MQMRRILPVAIVGVLAAGAFVPANAAPKVAGSYTLNLMPDPTIEVVGQAAEGTCGGVNPASVDKHTLTVPAAGRLNVVLDSPDPTGSGHTDWDLAILDKSGEEIGTSAGASSHEEIDLKLKKKTDIVIVACNLAGQPSAKVTYKLG